MRVAKLILLVSLFTIFFVIFLFGMGIRFEKNVEKQAVVSTPIIVGRKNVIKPTLTPTATLFPTDVPTPTPSPTETPFYDPYNPLKIEGNGGSVIDFSTINQLTISFNGEITTAGVEIYDESRENRQLGGCGGANLVISNAMSGNEYVTYKTLIYGHSGACKNGNIMPFEYLRLYLEGAFYNPDQNLREERLREIVGKEICFEQTCFVVVDATYVSREKIDSFGYVGGKVDWYFGSGEIPNVQEIFLAFCGSEGGIPTQWFTAKYFLRLQKLERP